MSSVVAVSSAGSSSSACCFWSRGSTARGLGTIHVEMPSFGRMTRCNRIQNTNKPAATIHCIRSPSLFLGANGRCRRLLPHRTGHKYQPFETCEPARSTHQSAKPATAMVGVGSITANDTSGGPRTCPNSSSPCASPSSWGTWIWTACPSAYAASYVSSCRIA